MRKLYTLLLLVLSALLPMVAEAAPVTVQQAREKAVEFFMTGSNSRAVPTLELAWSDRSLSRGSEEAALYIFNRTDRPGFVMMAGDDVAAPVLGYSFEHAAGDLDEMPAHIRYYLDGLSEQIEALRASGAATNAAWAGELKAGTPVRELPTALWDQGEPFNRECPVMSNGNRTVTGCVQTAAAIMIKYNRWPDSFTSEVTVPGYRTAELGLDVPGRTLRSYDFDKMPDTYYQGQYTDEQAAEVARLMADLGVMDRADYGPETGAHYSRLEWALGEYMRYSKQASYVTRAGYSDDEWAALIKKEIDANRPLLYDGQGQQGGHAFVLDGYDTENYFRFNWGWGGQLNGYFVVKNLTPGNFNFSSDQGAIINLIPDKQGTTVHNNNLLLGKATLNNGKTVNGLEVDVTTITPNTPFNAQMLCWNASETMYSGKLAVVVASKEREVKEVVSAEIPMQLSGSSYSSDGMSYAGYYAEFTGCTIKQPLFPGARLRVAYWNSGTNSWDLMGAYNDGVPYQIQLMPDELTPESVAEVTKISYNRTTKKLSVFAPADIQVSLLDSSSKSLGGGMSSGEPVVIDLQSAAKGSYLLVLTLESGKTHTTKLIF